MSELSCKYVSSHGILKSCSLAIRNFKEPNVIFNISHLKKGNSLYLDSTLIKIFYKSYWQYVKEPIVLVSGNQDINFTDINEFKELLEEEKLIKWYSQNMCLDHEKCIRIPIGLDYHTLYSHLGMNHPWSIGMLPSIQEAIIDDIRTRGRPISERRAAAFCNWQFFLDRGDRREVLQKVDMNALYMVPNYQGRNESWMNQMEFAFVCSPSGGGLDCHRTWEALILGCVPIVKSSGMDSLFDGLPVWIVKDWSEVTLENCVKKKEEYSGAYSLEKLDLSYWVSLIRAGQVPV